MDEIRMVDLISQHNKIRKDIDDAISKVIDAAAFIQGPQLYSFEKNLAEFLKCNHAIGCANGTDALQLALMALNLPANAEVITSDFTFVATAEVIKLLGLKPVLVDVNPDTFTIDPQSVRNAITDKTKVIIPVHLFGQCADMQSIMDIAREFDLHVIEDTAQALGSIYTFKYGVKKNAGTMGIMGSTSFFPSKNLGCMGDGGAIFSDDKNLAEKLRILANHGMNTSYLYESVGINSRLDTLQAAILEVKLKHLEEYNSARQAAAAAYDDRLKDLAGIQIPVRNTDSTHIFHQYTLKVFNGKRDGLMEFLKKEGIPTKVYYPLSLHAHPPYKDNQNKNSFEVSNKLSEEVLSLPMHTELNIDQIEFITDKIKKYYKSV